MRASLNIYPEGSQMDYPASTTAADTVMVKLDPVTFAKRLQEARAAAGLTQQQLADACGLTKGAVSAWENAVTDGILAENTGKRCPDRTNSTSYPACSGCETCMFLPSPALCSQLSHAPKVAEPLSVLMRKTVAYVHKGWLCTNHNK